MPARYAKNQRGRTASQRAGRRVGKPEAKRLASYRVDTSHKSGPNGFPVRTTYPKGGVTEDGYDRKPGYAKSPKHKAVDRISAQQKVMREQLALESAYKRKTGRVPTLAQREAPGWPDNTPTQQRRRKKKSGSGSDPYGIWSN